MKARWAKKGWKRVPKVATAKAKGRSLGAPLKERIVHALKATRKSGMTVKEVAANLGAKAFKPEQLAKEAFRLYEEFRPGIPAGVSGWGAKGELDLNRVRALAPKK